MDESEGQSPGRSPTSRFLGLGLLGSPGPEGNHNLRNGLLGGFPPQTWSKLNMNLSAPPCKTCPWGLGPFGTMSCVLLSCPEARPHCSVVVWIWGNWQALLRVKCYK